MKKRMMYILTAALVTLIAGIIPSLYSRMEIPQYTIISGEGLNKLDSPNGAVTDDNRVFIANSKKNSIAVFNLEGEFQFPIGRFGENDGELQFPVDVELYQDQLFVADLGNNRIQVFTKEGQFLDLFPRERNIKPAAITIAFDKVYVSDIYSQTIKVYSPTGKLLQEFGARGKERLNYANGLTVMDNGDVVVSDSQNNRIAVFDSNGSYKGHLLKNEKLGFPKGMTNIEGDILVADATKKSIYRFSASGKFEEKVLGDIELEFPVDVSVSNQFNVITDNGKNEVILARRGE